MICEWYVLCTNDAVGMVYVPAMDKSVHVCECCCDKHGLKLNDNA